MLESDGVAESNAITKPRPGPTNGFRKGQSGNPGGRPKGLARYIREQTREGEELVDLMLECARGKMRAKVTRFINGAPVEFERGPTHADRLDALKFLVERGLGHELQSVAQDNTSALASYTSVQLLAVFDRVRQLPADTPARPDEIRPDDDPDTP